jgi:dihydroorotate dehydrogenase (NAD+) catalytic subunit
MADLSTEVCGLRLPQPILPAAGPPVRDGAAMLACAEGGAGGLVAKTISTRAAEPPTPNMAEVAHGMVNTELWSELPPEQWLETEYALARTAGLPLIVSLGYTADEIAELAPKVAPFADAVELSTHYIGEDPEPMIGAVRAAKAALDVPVLVKLSPHGHDMASRGPAGRRRRRRRPRGDQLIRPRAVDRHRDGHAAARRPERLRLDQRAGAEAARGALRA